jgi:hypothetical protein
MTDTQLAPLIVVCLIASFGSGCLTWLFMREAIREQARKFASLVKSTYTRMGAEEAAACGYELFKSIENPDDGLTERIWIKNLEEKNYPHVERDGFKVPNKYYEVNK